MEENARVPRINDRTFDSRRKMASTAVLKRERERDKCSNAFE